MKSALRGASRTALLVAFAASAVPEIASAQQSGTAVESDAIVVTARKREESVQDIPLAVSVLSGQDIAKSSAIRISDALQTVPNLNFQANSLGGSSITIRGISSSTNNFGIEPAVAVYVDEVYLARPNVFDQSAVDLARVEVLRGPQGTLFGRNTVAGVINIATSDPADRLEGALDATYGRFDLVQVRGTVSAPLGENAGLRISGNLVRRDGWFKQIKPGLPDFNNQDTTAFRAKLRVEPMEGFDMTLTADYAKDKSVSGNNDVVAGALLAFDTSGLDEGATTIAGRESREFFMTSLRMNKEFGDYTVTSITAYQAINYDRFNDQDYTVLDILSTGAPEKDRFFSQEVRLSSPSSGPFSWIIGGFYSDAEVRGSTRAVLGADTPVVLGIGAIPGYTESEQTDSRIDSRSLAAFGSFTYAITDNLVLSGGLRYTHERKKLNYRQTVTPYFVAPGVPVGIIYAFATDVPETRQTYSDDALSGDASLTYRFTPDTMAYLRFSRGYKAGGFDSTTSAVADPGALSFGAEEVDLYEAGFKTELADNRVRFNAAMFHMDYRDKQEQIFNGVSFLTRNAASATVKGFEVELNLKPTTGLVFNFNLGYSDAKYGTFVDKLAGTDFSGNRLPGASRWAGGATGEYGFDIGGGMRMMVRGEISYRSKAFTTADNDLDFASRDTVLVNTRAGIEFGDRAYGIYAWGRNVFNERYVAGGFDFLGSTYVYRNMPATWGLELRASF